MSDLDFETRLDRLFAEPPHFKDSEVFASLVESRLERGWSVRRLFIGAAGVVAGLVGVGQLMGAGLFLKAAGIEATEQADAVSKAFSQVVSASSNLGALPISPEVLWMTAALGVMALGFAITRATQEF
jgi:hypothetical protein